jgi:chemotaxis-related protein WspB
MLFVLFQVGKDRYAIRASEVVEVLPLVDLKTVPSAHPSVAGILMYRGKPAPVIDLTRCLSAAAASQRLSTRILVVNYTLDSGETRMLGLMAERANETIAREESDFTDGGVSNENAPYLGPVAQDSRGLIQWVQTKVLLPPDLQATLFRESSEVL